MKQRRRGPLALSLVLATAPALLSVAACGPRFGDPIGRLTPDAGPETTIDLPPDGGPTTAPTPRPAKLPEFCTADGWCGTNLAFSAVWGTRFDDVWLVAKGIGDSPTASAILHWDGTDWTTQVGRTDYYAGEQADLEGIWGSGPNDVWVAGSTGTLLHWNGATWKNTYVGGACAFKAIWGSGPGDVWAVGDAGAIDHWNGTTWEHRSGPYGADRTLTENLTAIWGSGPGDVWAVGDAGTILHWNGASWSRYQDAVGGTATTANLRGVWGTGPTDVWAVGAGGMILRSNGTTWTIANQTLPTQKDLKSVWGTGPGDVWVTGAEGTLLHYTGAAWYAAPAKTAETLLGVWGVDGELWAVGERGAALHWDRTVWAASPARPVRDDLFAVFVNNGAGDAWVAGAAGRIAHWDGAAWGQTTVGSDTFNGIWGDGVSQSVFLAGDGGKIVHCILFEGQPTCSNWGAAGDPDFKAVWGSGPFDTWFGGAGGALRRQTESQLLAVPSPTTATIQSIWGTGPDDVWAATNSADVLHWDGVAWTATAVPGGSNGPTTWRLVMGIGPNDVWLAGMTAFSGFKAGGAYPVVARWNGSTWTTPTGSVPLSDPAFTTGAWTAGPADLWTVSPGIYQFPASVAPSQNRGPIMHWDGSAWSRSSGGARADLYAIAGTHQELWAVGARGTILRRLTPGP